MSDIGLFYEKYTALPAHLQPRRVEVDFSALLLRARGLHLELPRVLVGLFSGDTGLFCG